MFPFLFQHVSFVSVDIRAMQGAQAATKLHHQPPNVWVAYSNQTFIFFICYYWTIVEGSYRGVINVGCWCFVFAVAGPPRCMQNIPTNLNRYSGW